MGRYPRAIRGGLRCLDAVHNALPILAPRKAIYWSKREKQLDAIHRAGSLCFVLTKDKLKDKS